METGQRVEVYRNLTKRRSTGEVWYSVRSCSGNRRVIGHVQKIVLGDCKLIVRKAGRKRCLREKRKNVHAFIRGTILPDIPAGMHQEITYNPYKYESFVWIGERTGKAYPVHEADCVVVDHRSVAVRV